MADFSTLIEPFDTLDDAIWGAAGNVDFNGDLVIQPDGTGWANFLFSSVEWKLDYYDAPANGFVEFVPYATRNNGRAAWGIVTSPEVNQGIIIEQTDASTYTVGVTNGNNLTANQSYATTDRFWRVVLDHDNATVYYTQSSADSVSWTFRKTLSASDIIFPFPRVPGVQAFVMQFRIAGGSGTTRVAGFRRINDPPLLTSVAVPGPATASSRAPIPVVQQWTTVNLTGPATAATAALPPTLKVYLSVPTSMSYALALEPVVLLPIPVAMSPPVITGSILAIPPSDVIAPAPFQINALTATATCLAYPPGVHQLENTSLAAPAATASITLLPPGEYVRISAPPAAVTSVFLPLLRVGPALSQFANTVVQTPQNWGGAAVYYRLSDQTVKLTDLLGVYDGGWSGDHPLVASAVVNDPDLSTQFNGTDTVAYNGLMPNYQPFTATDVGFVDGGVTTFRADEWPRMWGWSGMVVFRTLPDSTKQMYVFGRAAQFVEVSLRVINGRLVARFFDGNDWQEIMAGPAVNDGAWHMAVVTKGYPLDDELQRRNPSRLYLDGVLQGYLNFSPKNPTLALTIGGLQGLPSMEGALDEYAEFDYTLSKWEVIELWNQLNNLTGPGLRLETVPAYAAATMLAPTIRKSAVRPVNTFYDDFAAPFIDRTRWRDASPTARVINGGAVLRASGEQLLTADYFQAKDSTFIVRIDKLPIREGHIFVGLVNEYDIVDDSLEGGVNAYDPYRQHRTIGFDIWRSTTSGRTTTTIGYTAYGEDFHGTSKRQRFQTYIPDDPNYPSPMKWLRLDIDPGPHGGATWYTSPDGVAWTNQADVHGGKVSSRTTLEKDPTTGLIIEVTKVVYENEDDFYLFDSGLTPSIFGWRGYMRCKAITDGGNAATDFRIDNWNVYPQGTGTPAEILAKPARVETTSTTDYLLYAMDPRIYSSAKDISIEAPVAWATVRFPTPPPPVYVFTPVLTATATLLAPERAGDALPVAIPAVKAAATVRVVTPDRAGQAQDYHAEPNQATAFFLAYEPDEISTDQSSPAPVSGPRRRVITLKTRNVRVYVTQN